MQVSYHSWLNMQSSRNANHKLVVNRPNQLNVCFTLSMSRYQDEDKTLPVVFNIFVVFVEVFNVFLPETFVTFLWLC